LNTLKQEVTRQLEELSSEELRTVHSLIKTFKRPTTRGPEESAEQLPQCSEPAPDAARIHVGGSGRRPGSGWRVLS